MWIQSSQNSVIVSAVFETKNDKTWWSSIPSAEPQPVSRWCSWISNGGSTCN